MVDRWLLGALKVEIEIGVPGDVVVGDIGDETVPIVLVNDGLMATIRKADVVRSCDGFPVAELLVPEDAVGSRIADSVNEIVFSR